jgi:hypothetical protein
MAQANVGGDTFGAEKFAKVAEEASARIERAGKETRENLVDGASRAAGIAKAARDMDPMKRFANFATRGFGASGPIGASNATGMGEFSQGRVRASARDMSKAFGQSPLLSTRERRKFEDDAVAAGARPRATSGSNAHNAIRRGDSARRKEFLRGQERDKMGLEKTNDLLASIATDFKKIVN